MRNVWMIGCCNVSILKLGSSSQAPDFNPDMHHTWERRGRHHLLRVRWDLYSVSKPVSEHNWNVLHIWLMTGPNWWAFKLEFSTHDCQIKHRGLIVVSITHFRFIQWVTNTKPTNVLSGYIGVLYEESFKHLHLNINLFNEIYQWAGSSTLIQPDIRQVLETRGELVPWATVVRLILRQLCHFTAGSFLASWQSSFQFTGIPANIFLHWYSSCLWWIQSPSLLLLILPRN